MNCVDIEMSCLFNLFLFVFCLSHAQHQLKCNCHFCLPNQPLSFLFPKLLLHTAPCGHWKQVLLLPQSLRETPAPWQPAWGQDSASARLTLQTWDWISKGFCKEAGSDDVHSLVSSWPGVPVPASLCWSYSSCCPSFLGFNHCPSPVAQTSYRACVLPGILLLRLAEPVSVAHSYLLCREHSMVKPGTVAAYICMGSGAVEWCWDADTILSCFLSTHGCHSCSSNFGHFFL